DQRLQGWLRAVGQIGDIVIKTARRIGGQNNLGWQKGVSVKRGPHDVSRGLVYSNKPPLIFGGNIVQESAQTFVPSESGANDADLGRRGVQCIFSFGPVCFGDLPRVSPVLLNFLDDDCRCSGGK